MITLTLAPHPTIPWASTATPGAYAEASRQQFGAMPGARWDRARGYYWGDSVAIEAAADLLERARVCKIVRRDAVPIDWDLSCPSGFPSGLFPYQAEGAAWIVEMLRSSGAALLADEMGVGKTPQVIAACSAMSEVDSILVVCPAIVVPHWQALIRTWSSGQKHWSVTSYDLLHRRTQDLYDTIAIDEGHYCSNGRVRKVRGEEINGSLRSHHVRKARSLARFAVMTTGTPINAYVQDAWNPLDILWPGRWGTWWQFTRRYADGHSEEIKIANDESKSVYVAKGHSNLEELNRRLATCMLRRTKADVQLQLPPITRTCTEVALPKKAQKGLLRALQAQAWSDNSVSRLSISRALSEIEDFKLDAAEELAKEILAAGSRPLVLTTRKRSAEELAHRLQCPFVTGEDPATTRRAKIADAQAACATMYSVTTGIDLVGFDVVIFVGLDWVPSTLQQCIARIHRIGQERPCTVHFLIGRGTLDEVVRERVIERLEIFATAIGQGDATLRDALAGGNEDELLAAMIKGVMAA